MSDSVVHRCTDSAGSTEQPLQSYHSAWLSHWTKKSFDAAAQNRLSSSNSVGKKEHDHENNDDYQSMTNLVTSYYGPVKGLGKFAAGTSKVSNDNFRLSSVAIRNENQAFCCSPTVVPRQNGGRGSALKDIQETSNCAISRYQIKPNLEHDEPALSLRRSLIPSLLPKASDADDTSYRECHLEPDGVSKNAKEPLNTLPLFTDGALTSSKPWPVDHTASTSQILLREFDRGDDQTNLLASNMHIPTPASKEKLTHTNIRYLERDYQRHSAILVCEEKMKSQSKTKQSESSCLRQDRRSLLQTSPSTSNNHSPAFGGEQFQNIQNFSTFRLFQNQSEFPEVTKSQKLHHGYSSVPKFLRSIHDVETMRICTTVDSVVGVPGGHPRFSQTTHSLLITKKTDFNLNKEKQTFRNSGGSADRNVCSNLHNLSPLFDVGKKGVELQPLHGSKDGEAEDSEALSRFMKAEERDVHGVKAFGNYMVDKGKKVAHDMGFDSNLKNESSAETDVMELDELEETNQLSGVNSSPSNKVIRLGYLPPQFPVSSPREVSYGQHNSKLPATNFELPVLPAAGKMSDNGEPSTSRTQSLDMETLLANAEQLSNSESEHDLGGSAMQEPGCTWVKRLKLSASDSFVGTQRSNLGPSHSKSNLVLVRRLEGRMVNSAPTAVDRYHGKELMVLEKTTALPRCGESFSSGTSKGKDSSLSDSWIRRWSSCQAAIPRKKTEPVVVCEPQSSKLALEDLQKKQFPSIAAMALMGKAMSGFQPCQLQKKGSSVFWK